jgi:hypothetical protein
MGVWVAALHVVRREQTPLDNRGQTTPDLAGAEHACQRLHSGLGPGRVAATL